MGENLVALEPRAGLQMLFANGERPSASGVARALGTLSESPAAIAYRPDEREGWLELVSSGLTFDFTGLSPATAGRPAAVAQRYGLADDLAIEQLECAELRPGAHIAAGATLLPVFRVMMGLGAALAALLSARAISWQPAQTAMAPEYFRSVVEGWLAGGPFPALGLTGLSRGSDGSFVTTGLSFLTGQELSVRARPGESPADTAKLAVRVIDSVVAHGPLAGGETFAGPDGEWLRAGGADGSGRIAIERDSRP